MNQMTSDHPVASTPLAWSEEYCVGVPALDAEHQVLFELIGMLADAPSPVAPEVISQILDALAEYAAVHFEREEEYQRSIGYTDIPSHQAHHRDFAGKFAELQQRFARDAQALDVEELHNFLRHWIVQHVLHEDMLFARHAARLHPETVVHIPAHDETA